MGMRRDRCWYTKCNAAGTIVDLDGSHPRSLCPTHADGIRQALAQPGTYRVSWGRSKAEQIERLQEKIPPADQWAIEAESLFEQYGPPRDPETGEPFRPDDVWREDEDAEYLRLQMQAWGAREMADGLRDQIEEIGARTWDHPIVRVEVATR